MSWIRKFMRLLAMLCVVNEGMLVGPATGNAGAAEFPRVRVDNVRRAFHNGEHNAFTDLIRFRGKFYLTFRSCPDGHMVHPTSSIIVLCSEDARQWKQVHRFRIPYRDPRDPHFLAFQGRLFAYAGTWYSGEATLPPGDYDLNLHLGYACVSDDGDALRPCAELPSGGDTSYPGFVALDADHGLVSWYSSHEADERGRPLTAIYLADLAVEPLSSCSRW